MAATKQSKGKGKAAASKAAAARAEKSGKTKTVDFRGLNLQLPAKLPGTILFDLADLEGGHVRGVTDLLRSLLGEQQFQAVRAKIAEDDIDLDSVSDVLLDLLESILEASGLSQGE